MNGFLEEEATYDKGESIYSNTGVYLKRFLMRSKTFSERKLQLLS